MRYHFFLHYERFFQNLGKEGWRTFMHTTVCIYWYVFIVIALSCYYRVPDFKFLGFVLLSLFFRRYLKSLVCFVYCAIHTKCQLKLCFYAKVIDNFYADFKGNQQKHSSVKKKSVPTTNQRIISENNYFLFLTLFCLQLYFCSKQSSCFLKRP